MPSKRNDLLNKREKSMFIGLDLDEIGKIDKISFQQELRASLAEPGVSLTFRWSQNGMVYFSDLQIKYQGNWYQTLKTAIGDYSGSRTFFLGYFPVGTKLTIAFKVTAYNNTVKMIIIGSQDNPLNGKQLAPPAPQVKSLISGEVWESETLVYTVSDINLV